MPSNNLIIRQLGLKSYIETVDAMHELTLNRTKATCDELWFVEHPAVFTQGQAGKSEHILVQSDIPIIQSDRGGQVTYHAPGQQILYAMIDLKRQHCGVRQFVSILENTVIKTLQDYDIDAYASPSAPGVYIHQQKICSLGLRIKKGCTFHGLALNIDMDLTPFSYINPCGYAGLAMTQLTHFVPKEHIHAARIRQQLAEHFIAQLHYQQIHDQQVNYPQVELGKIAL